MSQDKNEYQLSRSYHQFITSKNYYHPTCSKLDSEKILKSRVVDGAYLIRKKTQGCSSSSSSGSVERANAALTRTASVENEEKYVLSFSVKTDDNVIDTFHVDMGALKD